MKWLIGSIMTIFIAVIVTAMPFKQKTILTWDAPTTNTDGTPITDLAGYKIYWSINTGSYSDTVSKDVGNVSSYDALNLITPLKGYYCFVVTAYDTSNNESEFSNEYCKIFYVKKSPPTNLREQ